jgi:hypothetical protein
MIFLIARGAAIQNNATRVRSRLHLILGDMSGPIASVIADDHAVLRESLAARLQSQPDFEVGGLLAGASRHLLDHRDHQLAIAVVQVG